MKYFLLNKEEVKSNIWNNPILIRTKSWCKIKKYQALKKKLDTLYKQISKDIQESNSYTRASSEIIQKLLEDNTITEISCKDFNALYGMSLYETQEQRIRICNKSEVLSGKLFGNEIR